MGNLQSDVGKVQFRTVRECAKRIGIHAQTLKNWLIDDTHGIVTLLEPARVGSEYGQLIIPIERWDDFLVNDWPAIRKAMEARGWTPRAAAM